MLTQPKGRMKVLAAIPCYNERMPIAIVATLARKHVDEVLMIDDGSRDGTADVAREEIKVYA
jgi:glycosyltransferase involved in cell wall biosynthesis